MMKHPVRVAATSLLLLAFTSPSIANPDDNPLSTFAKALTELIEAFDKLDETVAATIQKDDREILAKKMLRLSSGFYALKQKKQEFTDLLSRKDDNYPVELFQDATNQLLAAVTCFSKELKDVAPSVGILKEVKGEDVEHSLTLGLEAKATSLKNVAAQLKIPQVPGRDWKTSIIEDNKHATEAAQKLYEDTRNFAHLLEPSLKPSSVQVCVKIPDKWIPAPKT